MVHDQDKPTLHDRIARKAELLLQRAAVVAVAMLLLALAITGCVALESRAGLETLFTPTFNFTIPVPAEYLAPEKREAPAAEPQAESRASPLLPTPFTLGREIPPPPGCLDLRLRGGAC